MARLLTLTLVILISTLLSGQTPYAGMYVEEVPISAAALPVINAQAPGARCWRVYVCFDEPFWELQTIFGYVSTGNNFPLDITLADPATTRFFQSPIGGLGSTQINPAFYATFPSLYYDSFVTFKRYNSTNNEMALGPGPWGAAFEAGGSMNVIDPVGGSWYVPLDRTPTLDGFGNPIPGTWSTSTQNVPGPDNHIMVLQLTTNGEFTGHLNLSFRELSSGYIAVTPINNVIVPQVYFTNQPGVMDLPCAIVFLPVNVTHFDAVAERTQVNLRWVTESEVNNDYFTIERSADGENFTPIFHMDGAGNSSTTRIYAGVDHDPVKGTNYYRLRQTDFNGDTEVSDVIAVEFGGMPEYSVYPNPNNGNIAQVSGDLAQLEEIRINNASGQTVFRKTINKEGSDILELSGYSLPAGLYFVEFLQIDGKTSTQKLIVE